MVKLLVDSGAQIDNKDNVSTEPSMMLLCDSFLTSPTPHSLILADPPCPFSPTFFMLQLLSDPLTLLTHLAYSFDSVNICLSVLLQHYNYYLHSIPTFSSQNA